MTKTIKEIHDALKPIMDSLTVLLEQAPEPPPVKRGKIIPKKGDLYYNIIGDKYYNSPTGETIFNLTQPRFRAKEDADLYREITERAHELIGDWVADWSKLGQLKYYLAFYSRNNNVIINNSNAYETQGTLYMPERACNNLLEQFTQQELRFWITGVWV